MSEISKITEYNGKNKKVGERDNCLTTAVYDSVENEYWRIRTGIGMADYSHYGKFRVEGPGALDLINKISYADVVRVPINRMMPSYVLNEDGSLFCEMLVANYGDCYQILSEGVEPEKLFTLLGEEAEKSGPDISISDETRTQALIGLDGPYSWELLKEFMGAGIIGARYLEIISGNQLGEIPFTLYRSGKTGEYGYVLQVDANHATELWLKLLEIGRRFELRPVGYQALDLCRMENRFASMHHEAGLAKHVLELNTRVMASRDKDDYFGRAAVEEKLDNGIERRLVGMVLEDGQNDPPALAIGDVVHANEEKIGEIANLGFSFTLNRWIALGFLNVDYAYVGLDYQIRGEDGEREARTVSAPFIFNQSLRIRPQEDSYFNET